MAEAHEGKPREFGAYVRGCRERLAPMLAEEWVRWENNVLELAEEGWLLVRRAAAALDPRTVEGNAEGTFSKAI
ncbi:MAG: hypothetical protein ABIW76_12575 [Fibrobacteria bacterium]